MRLIVIAPSSSELSRDEIVKRQSACDAVSDLIPETARDKVVMGIVIVGGDLHDFTFDGKAYKSAEQCTDLALLFDQGAWAVENLGRHDQKRFFTDYLSATIDFARFPTVLKHFVMGVEDHLRRRVAFVGRYRQGVQYWIPVPPEKDDRWPKHVQPISPGSR